MGKAAKQQRLPQITHRHFVRVRGCAVRVAVVQDVVGGALHHALKLKAADELQQDVEAGRGVGRHAPAWRTALLWCASPRFARGRCEWALERHFHVGGMGVHVDVDVGGTALAVVVVITTPHAVRLHVMASSAVARVCCPSSGLPVSSAVTMWRLGPRSPQLAPRAVSVLVSCTYISCSRGASGNSTEAGRSISPRPTTSLSSAPSCGVPATLAMRSASGSMWCCSFSLTRRCVW